MPAIHDELLLGSLRGGAGAVVGRPGRSSLRRPRCWPTRGRVSAALRAANDRQPKRPSGPITAESGRDVPVEMCREMTFRARLSESATPSGCSI